MNFNPISKTVMELLAKKHYTVPSFQREYSWEKEHIDEFVEDLLDCIVINENGFDSDEYFIGSMVFVEYENRPFEIIDGQQRLITITLLLSAIRDIYKEVIGDSKIADAVQSFILTENALGDSYFIVETESPKPYFQSKIQNPYDKLNVSRALTAEEKRLESNYQTIRDILSEKNIASYYSKTKVDYKEYLQFFYRDLLLNKVKVIYVATTSKEDSYTVFEILNAKGMSLTSFDLVKNHLFQNISDKPLDIANERWKEMKSILRNRGKQIEPQKFFRHYWISKYSFTKETKIYYHFKKENKRNNIIPIEFIDDLVKHATYYLYISYPQIGDWREIEKREIFYNLEAFNVFNVQQIKTILLALLDCYRIGLIKITDLKDVLLTLEKFHFIFTAICSTRASGLEAMYSKYAREFRSGKELKTTIGNFKSDLKNKIPPFEIFDVKFSGLSYSNKDAKKKNLIQYIFRKIERYYHGNNELVPDSITLEHIASQSNTKIKNRFSIGNLIPLCTDINNVAGTASFEIKVKQYEKSNLKIVQNFVKLHHTKEEWTDNDIKERIEFLSKESYEKIWKI